MNKAFMLSLLRGGSPQIARMTRWLGYCMLLGSEIPDKVSQNLFLVFDVSADRYLVAKILHSAFPSSNHQAPHPFNEHRATDCLLCYEKLRSRLLL